MHKLALAERVALLECLAQPLYEQLLTFRHRIIPVRVEAVASFLRVAAAMLVVILHGRRRRLRLQVDADHRVILVRIGHYPRADAQLVAIVFLVCRTQRGRGRGGVIACLRAVKAAGAQRHRG